MLYCRARYKGKYNENDHYCKDATPRCNSGTMPKETHNMLLYKFAYVL